MVRIYVLVVAKRPATPGHRTGVTSSLPSPGFHKGSLLTCQMKREELWLSWSQTVLAGDQIQVYGWMVIRNKVISRAARKVQTELVY